MTHTFIVFQDNEMIIPANINAPKAVTGLRGCFHLREFVITP